MAFYINLESRSDRRRDFEDEFTNFNLPIPERFCAFSNCLTGCIGCTLSHLTVLKLARERNLEMVIIFEDDFQFVVSADEYNEVLNNLPNDFDVVMLSYNLIQDGGQFNSLFGICKEVQTASGYIVHSKFFDCLIDRLEEGYNMFVKDPENLSYINDQFWKTLQPQSKWYYCLKRVGIQRASYSDNFHFFANYNV